MLKIQDLEVLANNKVLLEKVDLEIKDGEIHVLMGPNGAGKSTICKAIMSHPSLEKTKGRILFADGDITKLTTDKIASLGIYYISQSPMEIEGVTNAELIRTSLQEKKEPMDIFSFNKETKLVSDKLKMPKSFVHREVNVRMSGGEKKKNELFGMWFLKPKLVILDEIDSGLDVDAINIVANYLKEYQNNTNCAYLIVSHQPTLLNLLKPTHAHIVTNKKVSVNGSYELVLDVLKNGFTKYLGANAITDLEKGE